MNKLLKTWYACPDCQQPGRYDEFHPFGFWHQHMGHEEECESRWFLGADLLKLASGRIPVRAKRHPRNVCERLLQPLAPFAQQKR